MEETVAEARDVGENGGEGGGEGFNCYTAQGRIKAGRCKMAWMYVCVLKSSGCSRGGKNVSSKKLEFSSRKV